MTSRPLFARLSAALAPSWIVWPFLVAVALLWLPFGFQLGGLIEEWDVLGAFVKEGVHFVVSTHSEFAVHILRPLTVLPHAVAYTLDPDSFFYWHVLLIASLVIKGASLAWLLGFILRSRRAAVFGGLLFLLFPADTMQLCFRSLHINWALALVLLASACLVGAYEAARLRRHALAACAALTLVAAILMYEVSLFLSPLPFLVLFARLGGRGAWRLARREWTVTAAWLLALAACAGYIAYVNTHFVTYQNNVTSGPGHILTSLHVMAPKFLTIALPRVFAGGWYDAARILVREYAHYGYLAAMTALLLATAWLAGGAKMAPDPILADERPPLGRLTLAGIATVFLGYCSYFSSPSHLLITQRTYLYASAGGAMAMLALSLWIVRRHRVAGFLWCGLLLLLGSAAQLYQFHHYVALSTRQKTILRSIDEGTPSLAPKTPLLINDASARMGQVWMLGNMEALSWALTYLFNQPVIPEAVVQPGNLWILPDSLQRPGSLTETPDAWILDGAKPLPLPGGGFSIPPKARSIPKNQGFLLNIARDGSVVPAASAIESDVRRLARYRNVLQAPKWPFDFGLFPVKPSDRLHFSFGDWWNMDVPPQGAGWRDIEWNVPMWDLVPFQNGFSWSGLVTLSRALFPHQSMAWKVAPVATLLFDLRPSPGDYALDVRADLAPSLDVAKSLQIAINHHPLAYSWAAPGVIHVDVPPSILESGQNEIEFTCPPNDAYYGLSLRLQGFDLKPKKARKSR